MQVIKIPYKELETIDRSISTINVKDVSVKKENFKWIFNTLMAFTGGNKNKSVVLTAICLKETNGTFCGKSKAPGSTAAGLFQCTFPAVKDILSNGISKQIVEEILPQILGKKKELIDISPENLWSLQQSEQSKSVGILLGYAYFELNLSKFGMIPLASICAHYLPAAAKAVQNNIKYLKNQKSLQALGIALKQIEQKLDDKTARQFRIAKDNNSGQGPFEYGLDVATRTVAIYKELGERKTESEVLNYLTGLETSHSGSSLSKVLTDREHNLCEYYINPTPVEKNNVEFFEEIISSRNKARDVNTIQKPREKLENSDKDILDQNTEALKGRIVSNTRQLNKVQAKVFSRKKYIYATGFGPLLDPVDSIYEVFTP